MHSAAHKQLKRKITASEFLQCKAAVFFRTSFHPRISQTVNPPSEQEIAIAVCGKVSPEDRVFYGLDHMEMSG